MIVQFILQRISSPPSPPFLGALDSESSPFQCLFHFTLIKGRLYCSIFSHCVECSRMMPFSEAAEIVN